MANTSNPRGFKPVDNLRERGTIGRVGRYLIPSTDGTAVYVGDLVKLAGAATAGSGDVTVAQAAAGDTTLIGVVVGIDQVSGISLTSSNLNVNYRPASTAMYVFVSDDPDTIYEAQVNSVGVTTTHIFVIGDMGENCDVVVAAGNTTTGLSGMQVDGSSHTTSAKQLRTIKYANPLNEDLTADLVTLQVMINQHAYKTTTGV